MRTAILITDGVKQIMFTPETESEKQALLMISPDEDIHTVIKKGSFADNEEVLGFDVYECKGGFYRAEERTESVMFVLTSKKK